MDALLYTSMPPEDNHFVRWAVEKTTAAKLCNMLFNLPEVLKNLEVEFEKQKAAKAKFTAAQELGGVGQLRREDEEAKALTEQQKQHWYEIRKEKHR